MTEEEWTRYKDLEFYLDRLCACGCNGRIRVKPCHRYTGIPRFINGHGARGICHSIEAGKRQGASRKNKEKVTEIRLCEECGGFIRCRIWSLRKFCSRRCAAIYHWRTRSESEKNEIFRKISEVLDRKVELICEQCGRKFRTHRYRAEQDKYCSQSCYGKAKRDMMKQLWEDSDFREKTVASILRGMRVKPNKPEKVLEKLLSRLTPGEYILNVGGEFIVNGKCPDFINVNGQKKIIEHFGDFWHGEEKTGILNEQHEEQRVDCFAEKGYQTLIIWQHELENIEELCKRIIKFNGI